MFSQVLFQITGSRILYLLKYLGALFLYIFMNQTKGNLSLEQKNVFLLAMLPTKRDTNVLIPLPRKPLLLWMLPFFEKTPFFSDRLQGGRQEEDVQYFQTQNLDFSESLDFLDNLEEADIAKAKNLGESN